MAPNLDSRSTSSSLECVENIPCGSKDRRQETGSKDKRRNRTCAAADTEALRIDVPKTRQILMTRRERRNERDNN
jgi:hypothetical protein